MLCNLKAKELITCAVSPEGKDSGRVAPGLGGWAERKPLPSPSPCSELRWLLDKTEKSRGKHTCTHSRDSSFCPGAPGLCGLLTTRQGPLFFPISLLPRTAFRPLQLMLFLKLRSRWGIVGRGAVLASHPCTWLSTAHKPLLAWQLHSGSSRKSLVAFFL